ncbi:helix-turn-helix transcriptional regulator [Microbacterium sp. CFBP 8790]|uniref:helix-turn-helix transcriptional regulator n=1 Tax=unclassified Microbacterium TaxID=2609290 RepID=UPI00177D49F5|nr:MULTISPECIES: helix-turn-helix transcriptional regulator [unclassified Microbacterium]MBD8207780.1 helix-turn-helix transcriptional regulator [Microbacterium sp. CFBP 8801]MBD8510348.1 helix-turn-helix transcriptional regulator [Microbacterium sp. CFBP 8790]
MTLSQNKQLWVDYAQGFGCKLQRARTEAGLSQERVALGAGISTFTYQKLEKGESNPGTPANPRLQTLVSLALVLGLKVEDLLPPLPLELRRQPESPTS